MQLLPLPELNRKQKIVLAINGCVHIGYSKSTPVYAVKCKKHGLYVDYPHGFDGLFYCNKCWKEREEKRLAQVIYNEGMKKLQINAKKDTEQNAALSVT